MDEPGVHYAKWNKPHRRINTLWFHFYTESEKVRLIEAESRMASASGGGNGEILVKANKLAVIR